MNINDNVRLVEFVLIVCSYNVDTEFDWFIITTIIIL